MDVEVLPPRVTPEGVREALDEFWSALFASERGRLRLASGFRIGRRLNGIESRQFVWPDDLFAAAAWVARETSYGRDVYQRGDLTPLQRRGRVPRSVSWVFADPGDGGGLPAPTVAVETSSGRSQYYWKLTEPVEASVRSDFHRRINARVEGLFGACRDDLWLRLPGTINYKYHDARVRISVVSNRAYDVSVFDCLLPSIPPEPVMSRSLLLVRGAFSTLKWAGITGKLQAGLASAAVLGLALGLGGGWRSPLPDAPGSQPASASAQEASASTANSARMFTAVSYPGLTSNTGGAGDEGGRIRRPVITTNPEDLIEPADRDDIGELGAPVANVTRNLLKKLQGEAPSP